LETEQSKKRSEHKRKDRVGAEREVTAETKRILLIGEHPDSQLFNSLQEEGYEVVACESPYRLWGVHLRYRPHFIIVHFCRPTRRDIAVLRECQSLRKRLPLIVAFSIRGDEAVMGALEKTAISLIFLPVKPEVIREVLEGLPSKNERKSRVLCGKSPPAH
jgi:DNA-binding NtrC family response regulator